MLATLPYDPADILEASQRVNWEISDLIGPGKKLDFARRFMPEGLARVEDLAFLDAREKRLLNQIRGNAYLYIFSLAEEFILPFVMDHTRNRLASDDTMTRALLNFAGEEAKHIQLFKQFRAEFEQGFGFRHDVIGPAQDIGRAVLGHHPLGVALVILHIEWMTQRHFLESVTGDLRIDPMFKGLLRHHWMEEAQHAKLDTAIVLEMAAGMTPDQIESGFEAYLAIGGLLDEGLKQQTELDIAALERASGRVLDDYARGELMHQQHQANRWTYLGSGMSHPKFLETVHALSPAWALKLAETSKMFS